MKLYGLKNCDTCRKAMKSLPNVEILDVRDVGVPREVLQRAHDVFGAALLNTRSTTWRGLTDAERRRAPLDLIMDHPALMKRPLIERDGELFLGWTPDTRKSLGVD